MVSEGFGLQLRVQKRRKTFFLYYRTKSGQRRRPKRGAKGGGQPDAPGCPSCDSSFGNAEPDLQNRDFSSMTQVLGAVRLVSSWAGAGRTSGRPKRRFRDGHISLAPRLYTPATLSPRLAQTP
jgi:hypothetical protein